MGGGQLKAFVISMDLALAIGVLFIAFVTLFDLSVYSSSKYSYSADAIAVMDQLGLNDNFVKVNRTLYTVLSHDSVNFTMDDFGPMVPDMMECTNNTDCTDPLYPSCLFYMCGNHTMNIQTGQYVVYSQGAAQLCTQQEISEGVCKPRGDISHRMIVLTDGDRITHFMIATLEVAR